MIKYYLVLSEFVLSAYLDGRLLAVWKSKNGP